MLQEPRSCRAWIFLAARTMIFKKGVKGGEEVEERKGRREGDNGKDGEQS